jgi:Na+/glutamate symporter
MTVQLSFLSAVALAGIGYVLGRVLVKRIPWLEQVRHLAELGVSSVFSIS